MSEKLSEQEAPKINLNAPNSLSRALKPEYWALDEASFEVNQANLEYADPARFAHNLYDMELSEAGKFSLSYNRDHIDPRQQKLISVALTPGEYNLLLRSNNPKSIARVAMSRTIASKPIFDADKRNEDARRSGVHALENKLHVMETYKEETIDNDLRIINRMIEASKYPGLSRGKETTMRTDLSWIMDHVLENMFDALKYQKNWSKEQLDLAKTTTYRRMFFERAKNQHIGYFKELMQVNRAYTLRKKALINDRGSSIRRELDKLNG